MSKPCNNIYTTSYTGKKYKVGKCFSSNTLIESQEGYLNIAELKYGDKLKTIVDGKHSYAKFLGYLHFDQSQLAEFIIVKSANAELEITDDHLIQRRRNNKIEFVFARQLDLDDEILVKEKSQSKFEKINSLERIERQGIYAPLTETGTLLVNNVFASCFAHVYSHRKAQKAMAPLRALFKLKGSEFKHSDRVLEVYKDSMVNVTMHSPLFKLVTVNS